MILNLLFGLKSNSEKGCPRELNSGKRAQNCLTMGLPNASVFMKIGFVYWFI